ncbi:hypothetical protein E1193_11730 [Micromonospora sp. KC606]|nr:hypothetical protein E1193_11730 [Micromonospora sp. KC606]
MRPCGRAGRPAGRRDGGRRRRRVRDRRSRGAGPSAVPLPPRNRVLRSRARADQLRPYGACLQRG